MYIIYDLGEIKSEFIFATGHHQKKTKFLANPERIQLIPPIFNEIIISTIYLFNQIYYFY